MVMKGDALIPHFRIALPPMKVPGVPLLSAGRDHGPYCGRFG
jgi:hypothetical protein